MAGIRAKKKHSSQCYWLYNSSPVKKIVRNFALFQHKVNKIVLFTQLMSLHSTLLVLITNTDDKIKL